MTPPPTRLSVLIADDDAMIREALREVLATAPDLEVVATARDTGEAVALAERHTPSVAVLDVRMPGGGGFDAAVEIRRRSPRTRILAFSAYADSAVVEHMRRVGVAEYLLKGVPNSEIIAAVRGLAHPDEHLEI